MCYHKARFNTASFLLLLWWVQNGCLVITLHVNLGRKIIIVIHSVINSSTKLLEQPNKRIHLHLKLYADMTQEWQHWIDTVLLRLFQYLIRLFNVAVWSECTDAIIIFTGLRTVKFIKNPTQQEILPDAVQSWRASHRLALPGSQRQLGLEGVCWEKAPVSSCVPSRQLNPPTMYTKGACLPLVLTRRPTSALK